MAGRFAYFLIAGGAVIGGAILQGDIRFSPDEHDVRVARAVLSGDERSIERSVERTVERETVATRGEGTRGDVDLDPAMQRALSGAVAELVRAEASLISAKLDDALPPTALKQIEQRRDIAREAVERLADDAKTDSRADRDALREQIRESVRDAVRS